MNVAFVSGASVGSYASWHALPNKACRNAEQFRPIAAARVAQRMSSTEIVELMDRDRRRFLQQSAMALIGVTAAFGVEEAPSSSVRWGAVLAAENGVSKKKTFYDLQATKDGKVQDLAQFKGGVSLVVNVATYCALTTQYEGLAEMYDRLAPRGLHVLAFPCNQFGNQEPGSNEEICKFAREQYGAKFVIFDKVDVNGDTADPVYKFLKTNNPDDSKRIEWNFAKFLIDKDGQVVRRYKPGILPHSIERDIVALLDNAPLPMKRKPQLGVV
ncbi:putative phospholipid hydroperoxide glutathione peroxidase 6, mitochondrial [Porphyridium purpureum]|uniref:Glutathione peroxidase n=1 Tax=Porphyridium purpureum TaxID=35688 RepID=A0A5J4Z3F5_PORPP|nr:putative phospholipid hydroperoxide glutathione peroxidase 6, mitochondrial [Porphyridium purpureum]|eukprot:POR0243..scf208_2